MYIFVQKIHHAIWNCTVWIYTMMFVKSRATLRNCAILLKRSNILDQKINHTIVNSLCLSPHYSRTFGNFSEFKSFKKWYYVFHVIYCALCWMFFVVTIVETLDSLAIFCIRSNLFSNHPYNLFHGDVWL